jgi:hypothetical protein
MEATMVNRFVVLLALVVGCSSSSGPPPCPTAQLWGGTDQGYLPGFLEPHGDACDPSPALGCCARESEAECYLEGDAHALAGLCNSSGGMWVSGQ